MFTILAIVLFVLALLAFVFGIFAIGDEDSRRIFMIPLFVAFLLLLGGGIYFQTHWIVSVQRIGVARSSLSQELYGPYESGIHSKPFFASLYTFPASTNYERCEKYTPSIKGSYGVTINVCFYYDASKIDWIKEINRTGNLSDNAIMTIWRNQVVSDIATSVKDFTPEALSDNRAEVESDLFAAVKPWFDERNIPLVNLSFTNWDFTSEAVGTEFDKSIVSQRKIAEQEALLQASKISRERELYEAETARQVAEAQRKAFDALGFKGNDAIQYLWVKLMSEKDQIPSTIILGDAAPSIPVQ